MNKKEEIIRLKRVLKETNDRCRKLEIYVAKLNNATIKDYVINNSYYHPGISEETYYKGTSLIDITIIQQECINYLQREIGKLKYEQPLAMLLDYLGLEVTTLPAQPEKKVLTKVKKTK